MSDCVPISPAWSARTPSAGFRPRRPRVRAALRPARRPDSGFRITLRKSRAEPSQVYIIIDLADYDGAPPSHLFVLGEEIRACKHSLPPPMGGAIQILAEDGSDIIRALEDRHSEVFLR